MDGLVSSNVIALSRGEVNAQTNLRVIARGALKWFFQVDQFDHKLHLDGPPLSIPGCKKDACD